MGEHDGRAAVRLWRVEQHVRVASVMVFALFVLVAATLTALGIIVVGAILVWFMALAVMLFVWRWYLVPYVALMPDAVVIQGPVAHSSLRYQHILGVRAGLVGLRIDTSDGGNIGAWAIQKSRWATRLHRDTRADDLATEILERAHRATAAATASAPRRSTST